MSAVSETVVRSSQFRDDLIASGVLLPLGSDGLYARSFEFERVVDGIASMARQAGADLNAPSYRFPPVMPREVLEGSGYPRSFPHLLGVVASFDGDTAAHTRLLADLDAGGEWADALSATEVALCSAACHPLYPLCGGMLPAGGRTYEILGYCFRHEPSLDPARMQAFRQFEYVRLGDAAASRQHRDDWLNRAMDLLTSLGLDVRDEIANDPFFGRSGRVLASSQREQALKIELVCEIGPDHPVAISSGNCHGDHFGERFGITTADGEPANTACIGFGLERIALALLWRHGLDTSRWPATVTSLLWS